MRKLLIVIIALMVLPAVFATSYNYTTEDGFIASWTTSKFGTKITTIQAGGIYIQGVWKFPSSTVTKCYLYDSTCTLVDTGASFSGDYCAFSSEHFVNTSSYVYILADANGATYDGGYSSLVYGTPASVKTSVLNATAATGVCGAGDNRFRTILGFDYSNTSSSSMAVNWIQPSGGSDYTEDITYNYQINITGTNLTTANLTMWWNNTPIQNHTGLSVNTTHTINYTAGGVTANISTFMQVFGAYGLTANSSVVYIFFNDTINITSDLSERNGTQTSSGIEYNVFISNQGEPMGCTVLVNDSQLTCDYGTVNPIDGGRTGSCDFTGEIGDYITLTPMCNTSSINYTGAPAVFYFDNVMPVANVSFTNLSGFFRKNITGQFNFSDAGDLFGWNVSVDGETIASATNVPYLSYIYNLSIDPQDYAPGSHTLFIEVADGHTAQEIPEYEIKKPLLFRNSIEYRTPSKANVKIEAKDGSVMDVFNTEKKKDRYTFSYSPLNKAKKKYSFTVTSNQPMHIVRNDNVEVKNWIVTGKQWVDFHIPDEAGLDVAYTKINDYRVDVDVSGLTKTDRIEFHSIGDLNIVNTTYTFYSVNMSTTYASEVLEGSTPQFNLTVNITGTPYAFGDVNASLVYNGTSYTATKTSSTGLVKFSTDVTVPSVDEQTTFNWYWEVNFTGEPAYQWNLTQDVLFAGISNCSNTSWAQALVISGVDEDTGAAVDDMKLNINLELELGSGDAKRFAFEFDNSSNYSICIYPNETTYTIDSRMEYGDGEYTDKKYYLNDYELSNSTQYLTLYHLNDSYASDVILTVYDKTKGTRLTNAEIKIQRYYPGLDNGSSAAYKTVEIERTDGNGQTLAKMVLGDIWYKFIVEYPLGTVIHNSEVEKILSTEKLLPVSVSTPGLVQFNNFMGISGDVSCTKSTQTCRFTWSDRSNAATAGTLKVYEDTGFAKILNYSETVESAAATISYVIPGNLTGKKFVAEGWIEI